MWVYALLGMGEGRCCKQGCNFLTLVELPLGNNIYLDAIFIFSRENVWPIGLLYQTESYCKIYKSLYWHPQLVAGHCVCSSVLTEVLLDSLTFYTHLLLMTE